MGTPILVNGRRLVGIRMALGADSRRVLGLVMGQALGSVTLGLVIGGLLAMGAAVLIRNMLVGIGPLDPLTWGAITAILLGTATAAAAFPARRALEVDPMQVLTTD